MWQPFCLCSQSCRYPLDTAAMEEGSSLAGHLSKIDPSRLMRLIPLSLSLSMQEALQHVLSLAWVNYFWCCRLNKRFLNPSTGCGPCPPPSFSHTEEFFTKFITVTDRYRQKLKSTSVLESGVKFHSSSYKHGCCSHHSYVFNHHLMAAVYTEILKVSQCVHRL